MVQANLASSAIERRSTEFVFQIGNSAAQRRLSNVQLLRCMGDVLNTCDALKVLKLQNVHEGRPSICANSCQCSHDFTAEGVLDIMSVAAQSGGMALAQPDRDAAPHPCAGHRLRGNSQRLTFSRDSS